MKSIDHLILGKKLSSILLTDVCEFEKKLFILGNVLPDKLPHTYLCRIAESEKYRGHNFNNTKNKVELYMTTLMEKESLNGLDYLNLGIMCHYIADAFTYPHNSSYEGTLKDHVKYESILHGYIEGTGFEEDDSIGLPQIPFLNSSNFLYDLYNLYHMEYDKQQMNYFNDIHYISMVTRVLVGNILVSKLAAKERKMAGFSNPIYVWKKPDII